MSDRAAIATLVLLLSVSPCVALTPIFFSAGALGATATLWVAAANAVVTIPAMTATTLLASAGLERIHLERIENSERRIVGGLLILLGAAMIFLHHEHPGG